MTHPLVRLRTDAAADAARELVDAFAAIRSEFDIPADFGESVSAAARAAADRRPTAEHEAHDERDVEFVTIDPPGSRDLDQALALERAGSGYRLRYAIADVPAFVDLDGPIDLEARARTQTLYLPDGRCPLHPPVLSEAAASLLPNVDRPAFVWDIHLDSDAQPTQVAVRRGLVRSRAQLDYAGVQADLDAGRAAPVLALLAEVGAKRIAAEIERGGASLPMPEQEIHEQNGHYRLRFRPPLPAEDCNAQISLLTGMCAADLMLAGGVGILRTMPAPDDKTLAAFRRVARARGADWPEDRSYGAFLRSLDRDDPGHLALIHEATSLFRGAGYTAFDGQRPEQVEHAAVAAPYAHVTAPLRRLVDRFGLLVCAALSAGAQVPDEVRAVLPQLPDLMRGGDQRASAVNRAATDAVEAAQLHDRIGEEFDAVVVDDRGERGLIVAIRDEAIIGPCDHRDHRDHGGNGGNGGNGSGPSVGAGDEVRVRVTQADIARRKVRFEVV